MGEDEESSAETQAHDIRRWSKKNCSRSAGKVDEVEGGKEEVGCVEATTRKRDCRYDVFNKLSVFPKPSWSVFEPHSLSCVESLIFIRDGIVWN